MKLFAEIASSGNLSLLCKDGKAEPIALANAWEKILEDNGRATGNFDYQDYLSALHERTRLHSEYILVKAHIMRLLFTVDNDSINFLRTKGYKIDTTTASSYTESLNLGLRKAENIKTKIISKVNEIEKSLNDEKGNSIEEILASMSVGLGFAVTDDITLARFNEYNKILKKRNSKGNGRNK